MKVEFGQADQRLLGWTGFRHMHAFNVGWRPDAQSAPFSPHAPFSAKSISEREMEAAEFDASVEPAGDGLDDLVADKRLGAVRDDVDSDGHYGKNRDEAPAHPPRPAGSAPRRGSGFVNPHLFLWMPLACHGPAFSS